MARKTINILVGDDVFIVNKGDQRVSVSISPNAAAGQLVVVPAGTGGFANMPNGTVWIEY